MVEFIVPAITREDTRYYTLGRGGFVKRTGYALSRILITRTDTQNETFNLSEVVGAGASSGLSSLYYPSRERNLGNVGTEWGLDLAIDAAAFEVQNSGQTSTGVYSEEEHDRYLGAMRENKGPRDQGTEKATQADAFNSCGPGRSSSHAAPCATPARRCRRLSSQAHGLLVPGGICP